ncbi:MAG TPA: phosphoribosyltransferase family protein [Planctomycetota bacterium]|nr:phosphoribosyltransferase family protein [Planctomycetota bacterium]
MNGPRGAGVSPAINCGAGGPPAQTCGAGFQPANALPVGLRPLLIHSQIAARLKPLAAEICAAIHPDERPIAVVVLQGGFIFAADLLREFPPEFPIEIAFLRCQSYGNATQSSGKILLVNDLDAELDLHGRTALLIDDILDTGRTLRFLADHLLRRGAAKVRLCVLLKRAENEMPPAIAADFAGFSIGSEFVVGYGLDHAGKYRHLPGLAALK